MLKLWGPSGGDQTTPKAERKNPFDALPSSTTTTHQQPSALSRSHIPPQIETAATRLPPAGGARTPTTPGSSLHHHHLLHLAPHIAEPGPAKPKTPTLPTVPSAIGLPTTQLSLEAPEFKMKPPPLSRNATLTAVPTVSSPAPPAVSAQNATANSVSTTPPNGQVNGSGQSRGQLHVKVIQARGLNVKSLSSRPYVVVQFEHNEFVSRDPISDKEKEVKGVPQPLSRNNSSSALTSLAASGIARAFDLAARGRSGTATPVPSDAKAAGGLLFGSSMQPHNPTWKHEVSL